MYLSILTLLLLNYPQDEVRRLATKLDLPNRDRKDSQGICFLGKVCPGRVHHYPFEYAFA